MKPNNSNPKHTPDGWTVPVFKMFNGYLVSASGRVYSSSGWRGNRSREMIQHPNSHGYMRVRLTTNSSVHGKRRSYFVHKLVATLFLGPKPSPKHEVRHIDGDCTNNSYKNLCWGTRKDNAADRERHGRTSRGPKHSIAIKKGIYSGRAK